MNKSQCSAIAIICVLALANSPFAHADPVSEGVKSPDGSLLLFMTYEDGDGEIYTTLPDGSQRRDLTDNDTYDGVPVWSPDGKRILFMSERTGKYQLHEMDVDGKNVTQVTSEPLGVGARVEYLTDGRISYCALRKRLGKESFYDLILREGEDSKTIAKHVKLTDFAWHENGKLVAIGIVGKIIFRQLNDGEDMVVKLADIDERLYSHYVHGMKWQPNDDSITCRIEFLGGRQAGPNGPSYIFGDDEQFTISRDGMVSWKKLKS